MAFLGAYILHLLGHAKTSQANIEKALGAALLVGAAAMVMRYVLDRRGGQQRKGIVHDLRVKPIPTILIGMVGGLVVGMTSVGSGSLMIVMLLFLYPMLGANQLVGTDLTQAVPLTAAAALGALAFGSVEFSVTTSIIIGSIPAVIVGSYFSSRAPDRYIRPAITFVISLRGSSTPASGQPVSVGSSVRPCWLPAVFGSPSPGRGTTVPSQKPSLAPAEEPAAPSPAEIST